MAKFDFPTSPSVNDVYTSNNTTWQWDGTAWNVVTTSAPLAAQNVWTTINSDSGQTSANTTSDELTITGGTDIGTAIVGDVITINYTGSGGGGGGSSYTNSDVDTHLNTSSASTNEILSWNGSDYAWVADQTGSGGGGGSSTFSGTTDATAAGLNVAKIYEPAIAMLRVDNVGATSYTFEPHYSGNNPTIYALSGTTIAFDLTNVGGHPFEIQDGSGTAYNTGVVHVSTTGTVTTGAAAQGNSSGVLYWRIPETLFGSYRYQCQSHVSMVGAISLKRLSVI